MHKVDPNDLKTEWTDSELLVTKFKPAEWIVPMFLPTGLLVLAGRPFSGKSFLSLQLTREVTHGGFLFNQKAKCGKCLYLALEDRNSDLLDRMKGLDWQSTGRTKIFTEWKRFKKGGLDALKKELESGDYLMCIIDSLYKLLSGSKNERDGEMEPVMSELHNFCKRGLIDVMVTLYHSNKLSVTTGEGNESAINGDTSVAGVADSFWLLYHKPQSKQMLLHGEGRKLKNFDIEINRDENTGAWRLSSTKDKINVVKPDSIKGKIIGTLEKQKSACSATQVADLLAKSTALISREMNELDGAGLLRKLPRTGIEVLYEISKNGSK